MDSIGAEGGPTSMAGNLNKTGLVKENLLGPSSSPGTDRSVWRVMVGRIWSIMGLMSHLFTRGSNNDFEKKLQHLSKEEVTVHTRLKRRTQYWRKLARALIVYSVILELLVLGLALLSTRSAELSWEMRTMRVLPVFVIPAVVTLVYSTCASYYRMRERKDQKTLERLRTERQEKINELKEKTNYYVTQQLIQRYDPDPTAKAAAASILASKLGAESGLKLALAADLIDKEEVSMAPGSGRSRDDEMVDSGGLRKRKGQAQRESAGKGPFVGLDKVDGLPEDRQCVQEVWQQGMEIEPHRGKASEEGWIARLAAMLVGEDPTQCYALICSKCHMHNGLARKEDFQYVTYYCPHCQALNGSPQLGEGAGTTDGSGEMSPRPLPLKGMSTTEDRRQIESTVRSQGFSTHSVGKLPGNVELSSSSGPAISSQFVSAEFSDGRR